MATLTPADWPRMPDDEFDEHIATAKRIESLEAVRLPELLRGCAALMELAREAVRLRKLEEDRRT